MVKITYEYRALKCIGGEGLLPDGTYLQPKYEVVWVEGSEMCPKKEVEKRVKVLSVIQSKDFSGKEYRNISYKK